MRNDAAARAKISASLRARQPRPEPAPPFPRRTIVADYCRTCGRTSGCWQGCAGGERVAAISHTRSGVAATMGVQTSAPRDSLQLPGALDRGMVIPDV